MPAAQLVLATVMHIQESGDNEVIEDAVRDRRCQLVLVYMDAESPPLSKGTLVGPVPG